jgi:3-hydroxyisobutyrate dehydrogenase-like beta-hydroxyacid dehydrogenase
MQDSNTAQTTENTTMRVAFLGLGAMGMPMAANIAKAGHDLVLWNRSHKTPTGFGDKTPPVAATPADAVRDVEVAVTMLADDHAVESVVQGGLLEALPAQAVHVSMSTIAITTARRLADAHAAEGRRYVAAPVFGRPDVAQAQKLWIAAAGDAQDLARVRPVLQAIGRGITEFGPIPWHANLAKLGGNLMLATMLETFGEAYALMRKADIEPTQFLDVVKAVFQSPVYANYGAIAAERTHEPALFKASLGLKDLRLALAAADAFGVPVPAVELARDNLLAAIAHGGGDKDWSVLALEAQHRAGLD